MFFWDGNDNELTVQPNGLLSVSLRGMWAFTSLLFTSSLYLVAVCALDDQDIVFFSGTEPLMTPENIASFVSSRAHKWLCWYTHVNHACTEGIFGALSSAFWWSFRIHRTTVAFVTFCLSELDCILIFKKERIAALNRLNPGKDVFTSFLFALLAWR